MKFSVFHNAIHVLSNCGCKVMIERAGTFKLKTFSYDEVVIKEIDIQKFDEIKLINELEEREFDKKGIINFARTLGYIFVSRGI